MQLLSPPRGELGRQRPNIADEGGRRSLQTPEIAEVANVCQVRPEPAEPAGREPVPAWLEGLLDRPTVYVTFGTVFNRDPALTYAVVAGLAGEPMNVIVTLGPGADVEAAGQLSDNVRLCAYVPQSLLLERCDAVVCHGGIGSVLGALAAGLPVLALPRGADHFYNADRLLLAGAGRRLLHGEITGQAVAAEVARLIIDEGLRQAAARMAAEIASMPPPAMAIASLEELAGKRQSPRRLSVPLVHSKGG